MKRPRHPSPSHNVFNSVNIRLCAELLLPSVLSPKYEVFCRRSVGCFSRRERSAHIFVIRVERATRKNSQLAPAQRVAMKMGRRPRCSSVTYRFRYAPLPPPVRLGPPCRRPILIATKYMLFRGQDTSSISVTGDTMERIPATITPNALARKNHATGRSDELIAG